MEPSTSLVSGGEWPARNDCFSKLGDYFERPNWWDEGAQAISEFFNDDKPPADSPDKRLEDLLQSLEPYTVAEEPITHVGKENVGDELPNGTVNSSPSHRVQALSAHDLKAYQFNQSSPFDPPARKEVVPLVSPIQQGIAPGPKDIVEDTDSSLLGSQSSSPHVRHAKTETTKSRNNLPLENDIFINAASQESNEPASTDMDDAGTRSPWFRAILNKRSLLKSGATSSPVLTGTTTSTRHSSIQPDLSTRASSVSSNNTAISKLSPTKKASSSALLEKNDEPLTTPELPNQSTGLPQDDGADAQDDITTPALTEHTLQDKLLDQGTDDVEITAAATQIDPTGIQAIKDEFSEQYGIEPGHDSSFVSQDDDVTVVHDPSSAATSFFPPNPYSADPVEYDYSGLSLVEGQATSVVQDMVSDHDVQDASPDQSLQLPGSLPCDQSAEKDQVDVQDAIGSPTAPELPSIFDGFNPLLPNGGQPLPTSFLKESPSHRQSDAKDQEVVQDMIETSTLLGAQPVVPGLDLSPPQDKQPSSTLFLEESSHQVKTRADTPPAPPTSPLTPPAEYLGVIPADDQDAVSGAAEDYGDDVLSNIVPPTLDKTLLKLGKITPDKATTIGKPWGENILDAQREAVDELAQDIVQDQEEDDLDTSIASQDIVEGKRKQDQPHTDGPPYKKRLSAIPEDDDQPAVQSTESSAVFKVNTNKGKSKMSVKTTNDVPVTRSYHRDSTDELALTSPDEPEDPPASTPFALNKGKNVLSLVKAKLKTPTTSRSRARKAATTTKTSTNISKKAAGTKISKGGVGSKELASLVESSPPRKAAEKTKADLGSRLRGQSNTPAPTAPKKAAPVVVEQSPDPSTTNATTQPKRKRLPGSNPLGGHELADLGTVEETKTRARNSTAAPTPEAAPKSSTESAPKRVRKAAAKPAATPIKKGAISFGSFNLASRSNGTPAASRKKATAKNRAAEPEQEKDTPLAKLGGK